MFRLKKSHTQFHKALTIFYHPKGFKAKKSQICSCLRERGHKLCILEIQGFMALMRKGKSCIGISMRSLEWCTCVRYRGMRKKYLCYYSQILKSQIFLFKRTSVRRYLVNFSQTMDLLMMNLFKITSALNLVSS